MLDREILMTSSLKLCGVTIMAALLLALYGLMRSKTSERLETMSADDRV